MVMPLMVIALLVPTFLSENVPAIEAVVSVTASLLSTPESAAFVVSRMEVAEDDAL